jgi:hypothetical protein
MEKRPTDEQLAKYRKNAQDQSLSAEVRAKFQAVVDKFSTEPKERIITMGERLNKDGKVEPFKQENGKDVKPKATRGRKPATPKTKQTATDVEKAKAEIKAKTGKTEAECESIIEQYRALRTKAQEGKRKAEQASADNKERVSKLDKKGDIIEGTNEKTADAVIESTAKDVAEKIEKEVEAVEAKAEKEAKAEVEKDKTIKTPQGKKEAIKTKVEEQVKKKTETIVKRVVIDTSALLTSIATSLGKFDKDSQKEFLIKLRSDIDKLLSKYAFGGMTDGGVQVMNVQQSNMSSSSVNPSNFGRGGGVGEKLSYEEFVETLRDNDKIDGYTGKKTYQMEMYYLPSGHRYLGKTFAHKNKRKAYQEYLSFTKAYGYEEGGMVGQEIVFDYQGDEKTGVIKEIHENTGDYIVSTDDGRTLLAQRDRDVISLGKMREKAPMMEAKKKRFGFFNEGGGVGKKFNYEDVLEVIQDQLEDSIDDLPMDFENSSNFTGEEVEHESRDGFIPYTDGGYEVRWFEYISGFNGAGYSLPTKSLQNEMQRQVDYQYENAKQLFREEYPEIVEELGEENIDYNSLQEAGYESEAEELSEMEMNYDGDDTIMCEIGAYYYSPSNDRGIDGKHTLRLFGLVNLESPYHRSGNLEDRYDIDITFNSISELYDKVEEGLKEITEWFNGSKYNESTKELRINRMAKGGMTEHGLRLGDTIVAKGVYTIEVKDSENKMHFVNLNRGTREDYYGKGGKLWIDTKKKGGLKGVSPSRKNSFRNEAVKRGITSGQLANRVIANPSRYKGINPKSAQLVRNMGVRKQGGSIGDILRNRRGM